MCVSQEDVVQGVPLANYRIRQVVSGVVEDVIGERRLVISLPSASLPDVAFMYPLVVEVLNVALFPSFPCFQ